MFVQRLKHLLILFAGSTLSVVILFFIADWMSEHPRGFLRKLPSHLIRGEGFIKLQNKYHYFASAGDATIFLGNLLVRNQLIKITDQLKDSTTINFRAPDTMRFSQGARLQVDKNKLLVLDGYQPAVAYGNLSTNVITGLFRTPYFSAAASLSQTSFIFRVSKHQRYALVKMADGKVSAPYFLETQGDGLFSTDGTLVRVPDGNKLFYVYRYRNRFLCMDTTLQLLYKGKTIDSVNHTHIEIAHKSRNEITLAAPPLFVNEQCGANSRYLFVHSALRADNETNSELSHASVIDVYRVTDGRYFFSFYVGDFKGEKMRDLRIINNLLYVLFDHYLYKYQLNF